MKKENLKLIQDLESGKCPGADAQSKIQNLLDDAVKNEDVETLNLFLSSVPTDSEWGIGSKAGAWWQSYCKKSVLPALNKIQIKRKDAQLTESIIDALCLSYYKHPETGRDGDFERHAFELIKNGLEIDKDKISKILTKAIAELNWGNFPWIKVVELLRSEKIKESSENIINGFIRRSNTRPFVNMKLDDDLRCTIHAICDLGYTGSNQFIEQLMNNSDYKRTAIRAVGSFGNKTNLVVLKKRLGNVFSKPEKEKYARMDLKNAIKNIKERESANN